MANDFIPLVWRHQSESELLANAAGSYDRMKSRRSVREFSDEPVPEEVMRSIIMTAASASFRGKQTTLDLLPCIGS